MAHDSSSPKPPASSLADRVSSANKGSGGNTPSKALDWAEEATTPVQEKSNSTEATGDLPKVQVDAAADTAKEMAEQKDGATTWLGGSEGLDEPEFNVNVKLADLQADPNNPLFSVKSFDELNLREELKRALPVNNFNKPSKIQEKALPLLLKDPPQNLIGQSQSGTGKTAAFTLNMLQRVDLSNKQPQALVLAPTRELAKQIAGVARLMGTFLEGQGLVVTQAVPDSYKRGERLQGQIVVGTPGTVMDLIKRRQLDVSGVKILTLDEADNMLDMQGMGVQCKRVKHVLPQTAQVVLFSATFPQEVLAFAADFCPRANEITLEVEALTVKGIKQMYLDCNSDEEKYQALVKFYSLMTIGSSIIFVKRRDTAAEIERRMTKEMHKVASLTGALEGSQRDDVFNKFRSGAARVLITTNVLARGIDIQSVTMVINYDIPELPGGRPDYETYLHRIGRTGRFGRTGAALSLVHDRHSWSTLMQICKHFGTEPTRLDTSDWDKVEKMLKQIMKGNVRNAAVDAAQQQGQGQGHGQGQGQAGGEVSMEG